jgi:hypothetical protein
MSEAGEDKDGQHLPYEGDLKVVSWPLEEVPWYRKLVLIIFRCRER